MSELETRAYTNDLPWKGLGVSVEGFPTIEKMLKAADLDWTVDRKDMFTPNLAGDDWEHVTGFSALTRSTDNRILDVVGTRYIPSQNHEVFEFFREFIDAGSATLEVAGSLRGGRYVWALANLHAGFTLKGGDEIKGYLLAASPHQQGKSLVFRFLPFRPWCSNTIPLVIRTRKKGEFRMTHRSVFDDQAIARAKEALGLARDQVAEFEQTAKRLQKRKMDFAETVALIVRIFQPNLADDKRELIESGQHQGVLSSRVQRIIDVNEHAPGAQPGNAWGVLNAVTYYCDHIASRTADKRLTNAWLGKAANLKEKALAELLEIS